MKIVNFFIVLSIFFLTACDASKTHYQWGIYEDRLHADYIHPGELSPLDAAEILTTDVSATVEKGEKVPPGVLAHIAYLYFQAGELDTAIEFFNREKTQFPESSKFIDTLLDNLTESKK